MSIGLVLLGASLTLGVTLLWPSSTTPNSWPALANSLSRAVGTYYNDASQYVAHQKVDPPSPTVPCTSPNTLDLPGFKPLPCYANYPTEAQRK